MEQNYQELYWWPYDACVDEAIDNFKHTFKEEIEILINFGEDDITTINYNIISFYQLEIQKYLKEKGEAKSFLRIAAKLIQLGEIKDIIKKAQEEINECTSKQNYIVLSKIDDLLCVDLCYAIYCKNFNKIKIYVDSLSKEKKH